MTLYKKKGRRYIPCMEEFHPDHLQAGWWLLHIEPGCKSLKFLLRPDEANIIAAAEKAREPMMAALKKVIELRPRYDATKKDKKAIEVYKKMFPHQTLFCEFASLQEIVDAGINALVKCAKDQS